MICLVFNGYYRSGTTIFYRILKESNRDKLIFYEPLAPVIPEKLINRHEIAKSTKLHGFNPWDCYLKPEFKKVRYEYLHNLLELRDSYSRISKCCKSVDILPFHLDRIVERLFDMLSYTGDKVIIQPNRCHFILREISKRYGCPFIHIIRNPIDTWISQTFEPASKKVSFASILLKIKTTTLGRGILTHMLPKAPFAGNWFLICPDYKIISERFNLETNTKDWLDRVLIVWTYCNYYAFKQADDEKGMVVYYEEVTSEPERWLKIMSDFSGVNFDLRFAKILKPRITKDESLKKHFVERLERLGLLDMVNEFYPPKRWFGNS